MHDVPEKANPRGYPQCSVDDPRNQPGRKERERKKKKRRDKPVLSSHFHIHIQVDGSGNCERRIKSYVGIINGDCVE